MTIGIAIALIASFAAGVVLRNLLISNFKKGLRWLEDHIQ
jgi:hypothetical protein